MFFSKFPKRLPKGHYLRLAYFNGRYRAYVYEERGGSPSHEASSVVSARRAARSAVRMFYTADAARAKSLDRYRTAEDRLRSYLEKVERKHNPKPSPPSDLDRIDP